MVRWDDECTQQNGRSLARFAVLLDLLVPSRNVGKALRARDVVHQQQAVCFEVRWGEAPETLLSCGVPYLGKKRR